MGEIPDLSWDDVYGNTKNVISVLWAVKGIAAATKLVFFGTTTVFTVGYGGIMYRYLYVKTYQRYNILKKLALAPIFITSMPFLYLGTSNLEF
jgi:hypothetical protein